MLKKKPSQNRHAAATQAEVTRELQSGVNSSGTQFFESRFIVINVPYREALTTEVVVGINLYLNRYGIEINKLVKKEEYYNNTSSKKVNNYIVVKKQDRDRITNEVNETREMLLVGKTRYHLFEIFASVKYAMFSICGLTLGDGSKVSVLWIHLHSRLYNVLDEFSKMPFGVAQILSRTLNTTTYVMGLSPTSKSRDEFAVYNKGIQKENSSGRFILTEVKKSYGIDINDIMEITNYNLAVIDAMSELLAVREEEKKHTEKIRGIRQDFEDSPELMAKVNEDGEKLIDILESENQRIMDDIRRRVDEASSLVRTEPIGSAIYFHIDEIRAGFGTGQSKSADTDDEI